MAREFREQIVHPQDELKPKAMSIKLNYKSTQLDYKINYYLLWTRKVKVMIMSGAVT